MMEKLRHYLLAGLIMLLWGHVLYAQTAPPNNGSTDCGQTLDFDGVDEYVAVPYSAATNPGTISVSLWVYVKGFNGDFQAIAASRNSGPLSGWTLYITPENKFSLMAGVDGSAWDGIATTDDVQLNTWTHLAFTISGTEAALYVNGTSLSKTMRGNHVVNGGAEMRIGAGVTELTPRYFLNGQVAEFTLWGRALSATEVANLRAGIDIGTTNLVAYYDFNAESGSTTLTDRTGNGHTGTLHNMEVNEDWVSLIRSWYTDLDEDGYAGTPIQSCGSPGEGYSASLGELLEGDCNDEDATIHAAATWYADLDGDGYAGTPVESCTSPGAGYSESLGELLEGDCDDINADINPGKAEVLGNGIDDDCNITTFDMRPFVTIWKTDNYGSSASNQITIPTTGGGYDYTVYWESTTDASVNGVLTGLTGNTTITFPEAGTYRVEIAGDFPRIYFNYGGDYRKITAIEQWGDIAWTSMQTAFYGCFNLTSTATDAPDLSGVTSMSNMFRKASAFNGDLSAWDVSSVTDMSSMFFEAYGFNGDLSNWNVSSVTNMSNMFYYSGFNGDISNWDVSNVTNMYAMFRSATAFNGDISNWGVSNVTNMERMFNNAQKFNGDLSGWDVSSVTNMSFMFQSARAFNGDLSGWDVSTVINMSYMFSSAYAFNGDLSTWDISSVTNMNNMLSNSGLSAANYDATLAGWATLDAEIETKIPSGIYLGATGLKYCDAASRSTLTSTYSWLISGDTDISVLSGEPMAGKLPAIISADAVQSLVAPQAVNHCTGDTLTAVADVTLPITTPTTITWTYADDNEATVNITQQQHIFVGRPFVFTCEGDEVYLYGNSSYDYSYVIDWGDGAIDTLQTRYLEHMYATEGPHTISVYGQFPGIELGEESGLRSVEQWGDVEWRTMEYMFAYTSPVFNATDVPDLSQVSDMSNMFYYSGFNGDISNWDVSNVTNMYAMFRNATAFNGDISNWDVSNVTNMERMFNNAQKFNGDISNWNVGSVTNMYYMFSSASAFNRDLGAWDISNVTSMYNMLSNSGISATNYDATLAGWATRGENETKIPTGVYLGAEGLNYCNAANRNILNTDYSWTITGDTDISGTSGEPMVKKLPPFISEKAVASLEAPIAITCAGDEITAVTDVALPITASTTITWTYADGNEETVDITQQQHIFVGRPFVFTWEGDEVYLYGNSDYDYSYVIDWGDGAIDTLQSDEPEHWYATEGPHTISVYGQFPGIELGESSGLRSVEQWGDIEWRTMRYMFAYTSPEFNATDVPDLSQVTDMSNMFYYSDFNGDISAWDVSSVTNMYAMFRNATAFNGDISNWDVSNVTNMERMFNNAQKFNGDISTWDVSSVINMYSMFSSASAFNGDLGAWDISSVTNMRYMLDQSGMSAANYDATLAGWATLDEETETKIPTAVDLGAERLNYCNAANRNILITDYSWTITGDTDISGTSGEPMADKLPSVISEEAVTSLEAPVAITCAGDTLRAVTDVALPITTNTTITWTYADDNEATEDITQQQQVFVGRPFVFTAETSNIEGGTFIIVQPHHDFIDQTNVGIDWGDGATSHYDGSDPFGYHDYADQGVYTISIYGDLHGITTEFYYGGNLIAPYLRSIEQWGDMEWKTMEGAFEGTDGLQINATDVPNLSNVTSMNGMFRDATRFNVDISHWDVSNVADMSDVFANASAFNGDLSAWDVSNVTNMTNMLSNSGMSVRNYEATLKGWATLGENETEIPTGVALGADDINYCDATGRDILVDDYGWGIADAGSYCPEPPVLAALADKVVNEGETLSFTVAATAGELPFEYKLDAASLAKGMTLDPTTGAFSWAPTQAQVGEHSVTVMLDDAQSLLVSGTFTIRVNAAPVLAAMEDQLVDEDAELSFTATATDVDDNELTFSLDDASVAKGMAITSSGAFSWIPVQEQVGEHSVTVTVNDGALTDEETFTITVNMVNDAPVLAAIGDQLVDEDEALTFTATAIDADDTELTFSLDDTSLANGMVITSSGVFSWTPVQEQAGEHSVTITVSDGELTDKKIFIITVNEVNNAPVLTPIGGQSANEGEVLTFTATATDVDSEFTFSLDDASVGKGMGITPSGTFTWTPTQDHVGENSVTISVSDGELTDEETIIIMVNAVNDALVISSNAGLTLTQGNAAEITSEMLSVTDIDNTATELVYTVTALPTNGTLKKGETGLAEHSTFTQADIDDHLISYAHDGFNGAADEFSFTVTDGSTTLTSTFAININTVMAAGHNNIGAVSLYPVPAEDVVTLRITNAYRGNVSVQLFDANGREMLTVYTVKDRAELVYPINITSILSGAVLVKVKTGNHTQSLRMIKK